ncbi:MAG: hypothetical protein IT373_32780 [Polyangiaceae bacterium]|nr:hypothetical protein [Polyangiaceae bacterium]
MLVAALVSCADQRQEAPVDGGRGPASDSSSSSLGIAPPASSSSSLGIAPPASASSGAIPESRLLELREAAARVCPGIADPRASNCGTENAGLAGLDAEKLLARVAQPKVAGWAPQAPRVISQGDVARPAERKPATRACGATVTVTYVRDATSVELVLSDQIRSCSGAPGSGRTVAEYEARGAGVVDVAGHPAALIQKVLAGDTAGFATLKIWVADRCVVTMRMTPFFGEDPLWELTRSLDVAGLAQLCGAR